MTFEDVDARPGSTTSVLRTIVGLYFRRLGGWIAISDLVQLMDDAGTPPARTRQAVVRLKKKSLLIADRRDAIGYRLNPEAEPMLARGDRRIFELHQMDQGDPWCLVSFSIPESHRDLRHQLRRRLQSIGCGMVLPALWLCPDYLADEVEEILHELEARRYAVLFRSEEPRVARSLPTAIRTWWDLDILRAEHELFLGSADKVAAAEVVTDQQAFGAYVTLIDSWRILPYIDPGLPAHLLPEDWPGQRSIDTFLALSDTFKERAWSHVCGVVASPRVQPDPPSSAPSPP